MASNEPVGDNACKYAPNIDPAVTSGYAFAGLLADFAFMRHHSITSSEKIP
jgi:hypothetical protein